MKISVFGGAVVDWCKFWLRGATRSSLHTVLQQKNILFCVGWGCTQLTRCENLVCESITIRPELRRPGTWAINGLFASCFVGPDGSVGLICQSTECVHKHLFSHAECIIELTVYNCAECTCIMCDIEHHGNKFATYRKSVQTDKFHFLSQVKTLKFTRGKCERNRCLFDPHVLACLDCPCRQRLKGSSIFFGFLWVV